MSHETPTPPPTKAELLTRIRTQRARLDQAIARIPDDHRDQPIFEGGWSVKDTMAHITDWEQYLVQRLSAAMRGEQAPKREMPTQEAMDQINNQQINASRRRSLSAIQAAFQSSHTETVALVERLSEDDLFGPSKLQQLIGEPVWQYVAGETYEHYEEHAEPLEQWLDNRSLDQVAT